MRHRGGAYAPSAQMRRLWRICDILGGGLDVSLLQRTAREGWQTVLLMEDSAGIAVSES